MTRVIALFTLAISLLSTDTTLGAESLEKRRIEVLGFYLYQPVPAEARIFKKAGQFVVADLGHRWCPTLRAFADERGVFKVVCFAYGDSDYREQDMIDWSVRLKNRYGDVPDEARGHREINEWPNPNGDFAEIRFEVDYRKSSWEATWVAKGARRVESDRVWREIDKVKKLADEAGEEF